MYLWWEKEIGQSDYVNAIDHPLSLYITRTATFSHNKEGNKNGMGEHEY
jgi:hypothetical protein